MREIKFRLVHSNVIMGEVELKPGGIIDVAYIWDMAYQYTGLKDKNIKEIYESDIVRYPLDKLYLDEPTILHYYEVKWEQETCSWILSGYGGRLVTHRDYEIIGNIYENPELVNES